MGRRGELKGPKGAWDPTEGSLLGGAQRSYGFRGPNPRCGQESPLAAIRLRLRVTSESPFVCVTLAAGRPPLLNWEAWPRKVSLYILFFGILLHGSYDVGTATAYSLAHRRCGKPGRGAVGHMAVSLLLIGPYFVIGPPFLHP